MRDADADEQQQRQRRDPDQEKCRRGDHCGQRREGGQGGGKLWLASNKGILVGVDALTGTVQLKIKLGAPVYVPPVVAEGRLFVLTDDAKLIAFR